MINCETIKTRDGTPRMIIMTRDNRCVANDDFKLYTRNDAPPSEGTTVASRSPLLCIEKFAVTNTIFEMKKKSL